jgi:dihydrolipoamide dehydrogenase
LLHVAAVIDECQHLSATLASTSRVPTVNVDTLRGHKEKVISKLTGGLGADGQDAQGDHRARLRRISSVPTTSRWKKPPAPGQEKTGTKKVIAFKKAIIAAGSQAVRLPFMPEDPRVVDSTGAAGA